jgi:primosomal protein N'
MPPKCPHCEVELEYEERINDQNCGDYYYETWHGYCPKCKKRFYWDEVYNFSRCDNLEEEKGLE